MAVGERSGSVIGAALMGGDSLLYVPYVAFELVVERREDQSSARPDRVRATGRASLRQLPGSRIGSRPIALSKSRV